MKGAMAENSSKDLLKLEANSAAISSASRLESKLFVCNKNGTSSASDAPRQKPAMPPLPKSQVLGKVKDFLGVFSESNKKLLQDAKDNPANYDIEVLSGNESKYIEMDLMLGIADLHTPEAVSAAESAMAGYQQPLPLSESSSGSEDEDSREDDEDNDDDRKEDKIDKQDDKAGSESVKSALKDDERDPCCKASEKRKSKKRPKIVELA